MKTIEKVLVVLFCVALILRHILPYGATTIFAIACLGLFIFYLLLSFASLNNIKLNGIFSTRSYINIDWKKIAIAVIAGIVLSISVFGIICSKLNWPQHYASTLICIVLDLLLIFFSAINFKKDKSELHKQILMRVVPMCGALILLW